MNKFVFTTCLAVASMAAQVAQASDAVQITFDEACNTLSLSTFRTGEDGVLGGKNCARGLGTGFAGTFKSGKAVGLGVRFDFDTAGYYLVLSKPIVTGGTWTLYRSVGSENSTSTTGTYSVAGDPNASPQSDRSITDMKPTSTDANTRTVVVSFDGFCNVETITISRAGSSMIETGDGCDENIGEGLPSRLGHVGKTYGFGWTSNDARGAANDLVFSEPFTTGGTVTVYYTTNGITQNLTGPITYTVQSGPVREQRGRKSLSTILH